MGEKNVKQKGKRVRKGRKHESLAVKDYYKVSGETVTRKNKNCPRCSPGTILGTHKDRIYCGKCHYTEFSGKQAAAK